MKYRSFLLFLFFAIFALFITARLFKLQIVDGDYYTALAEGQHEIFRKLYPVRGNIYLSDKDQDRSPVAINKDMNMLFAVPEDVEEPDKVMDALKQVFNMRKYTADELTAVVEEIERLEKDINYIEQFIGIDPENEEKNKKFLDENIPKLEALRQQHQDMIKTNDTLDLWDKKLRKEDDPYEPLKHRVTDEEREQIENYEFAGIMFTTEITRYYPEKDTGSQVIGFVGQSDENSLLKGYYGFEGCYNKDLAGEMGFLRSEKDTRGRWIAVAGKDFREAENGHDFELTIDRSLQFFACGELKKSLEEYGAERGSVIVMEPTTGKILALCNAPEFDPNNYSKVEDISVYRNAVIMDSYEPGSVFKPFTIAAAMDQGAVDPFTGYEDTGEVKIDVYTIKNSDLKAHGWKNMTEVLEESLNTGTVFAARKIGIEEFLNYVLAFGFGKPTGVDLCLEGEGTVASLFKGHDIYLATASFGQGIMVTPLQLAAAYSAIANQGMLPNPYIVEKVFDKQGNLLRETKPTMDRQVISQETARQLSGMLVSVVKNGHATKARVEGYLPAGKTGTAQVADLESGGYSDKTIHTFAGFVPSDKPRFVIITKLDHVENVRYSSDSAAPLFSKIAKFALDYYNVPPEVIE